MKMNRTLLKKIIPLALAWTGMFVFCVATTVAQDQAPASAASPAQAAGQRTDGQIEMDVVHALDASKALKKDLITAATIQGEVTLSGTVSSEASSELAESIVGHVSGVTAVHNNLKAGNPQAAQDAQPVNAAEPGAQQMADSQPDEGPMPPAQGLPQRSPGPDQAQAPYPPPQPRPQYAPMQPQAPAYPAPPAYEAPKGPVTVPVGTLLQVRTSEPVGTRNAKDGTPVQFTVIQDVAYGGVLAIPRGATVHGVVTESKKAGTLGGSPELALTLTSLDLGGQSYPIQSDQFKVKGPNKAGQTVGSALGGGMIGTIIGCAVGRGVGCAVGAGVGVAAGTAASAASSGPGVVDSRRGSGRISPGRSGHGYAGEPAGSGSPGSGALSWRSVALPARRILSSRLSVRSSVLSLSTGVLPSLLRDGRVLLLAVRAGGQA
jgi:hypothetical protein